MITLINEHKFGSANPWTPLNLANLALFASAESADNYSFISEDFISQWNDLSGRNNHLTKGGQPRYINGATKFISSIDCLTSTFQWTQTLNLSIFLAYYKEGAPSSLYTPLTTEANATNGVIQIMNRNSSQFYRSSLFSRYDGGLAISTYSVVPNNSGIYNNWGFHTSVVNDSTKIATTYNNGDTGSSNSFSGMSIVTDTNYIYLNKESPTTNLSIESVIISETAWTLSEVQKVEGWWAHTFNHTDRLPVGHPYKDSAPTM